jgi:hypothetical protein
MAKKQQSQDDDIEFDFSAVKNLFGKKKAKKDTKDAKPEAADEKVTDDDSGEAAGKKKPCPA